MAPDEKKPEVASKPSWLERVESAEKTQHPAPPAGNGLPPFPGGGVYQGPDGDASAQNQNRLTPTPPPPAMVTNTAPEEEMNATQLALERFREDAIRIAREDAAAGLPELDLKGASHSESELRERARAFFERWHSRERSNLERNIAETEGKIADELGRASLLVDRFERLTNDLVRIKARLSIRRREVNEALGEEKIRKARPRGLPTRVYLGALGFLGLVEFLANGPVFRSLLPRDPLTERQIRLIAETSEGWLAGAQRVLAQLILRPDAALLAAGVVTFLCVLAHFFGHSLRDVVMHRDPNTPRDTVAGRSPLESMVPIILSTLGLLLVLGVLYEARVTLGAVGEQRFKQDMVVVEDLRRQAGWQRVDGDLLAANELENRAEDMEGAAAALKEYAGAMSRLSFPILLLNMTLVLCAISAAYFHQRDRRSEYFNESPFESERRRLVESAESTAGEISGLLSNAVRHIRELRSLVTAKPLMQFRSVAHQLEAAISLYRTENGRARGLDPRAIPAFGEPVSLDVKVDPRSVEEPYASRDPSDCEEEHLALRTRFEEMRKRFTQETVVV